MDSSIRALIAKRVEEKGGQVNQESRVPAGPVWPRARPRGWRDAWQQRLFFDLLLKMLVVVLELIGQAFRTQRLSRLVRESDQSEET